MKKSHEWERLGPSAKINLVAPGMPFLRSDLDKSAKIIRSWGWSLEVPKDILGGTDPICSQSSDVRWKHLKEAIEGDASVIWAARGGFGSLHLLPSLIKMKKPKKAKLLVGFSDLTTLHQFFNQNWNWPSFHGPHLDRLYCQNHQRQRTLQSLLSGHIKELYFKKLRPLNSAAKNVKKINSTIVGGNLITLQSTLGGPLQVSARNKILFLEEIGERGYRVERVFEHFLQLGIFAQARAVVLGPFVGGDEPNGTNKVSSVIRQFARNSSVPVFSGVRSGHIENSLVLPLNTGACLEKQGEGFELSVSTGVQA